MKFERNYSSLFLNYIYFIHLLNKQKLQNVGGIIVIYKALCFDVAQGRMNGAPNETRTHSCRFARQSC